MRCLSCNDLLVKGNLNDPRDELCADCYAIVKVSLSEFDDKDIFDHTIFNELDE